MLGVALALSSVAAAQSSSSVWTIPGTVNAGGLNNTRFVSDLAVTNPGSVTVQATISFVPANGTSPRQVTLTAGQTIAYRNVLDSLWGAQGAGATQVASDAPLLIRARTYNTAASGTFGVALPVFADDRLLAPGDSADSLWISQSADGTSGYRTNVAVVFPDEGGGEARVTVYDADGNEIGSQPFSLGSAGFQQFGVGSFAGSVAIARAEIQVIRGTAAAYSVVVDNVTGDSSLFTFESLPAGWQDVLVNGVARRDGRNSTFFRTDGRFYNPASEDATVTVAFHDNRNANEAPVTKDFIVPAGKIRDVVDVLDSLLGLPVGSAGALRFTSGTPVAILCRTSNVDPLGVKPGTFGAQQKPRPLLSFLMSADAGAIVTGIRQNAAFRTNVGFAAGADGAEYALTLKSAAGATVATATGSLGVFGWTQPNVADLFPGTTVPEDATLLVRVTSGSVDVFDSSIDNASGDPVVTPIMPLVVDIPSAATIGPAGGAIRSTDGALTLRVPAGALAAPTAMSIATTANGAPSPLGAGYDLSPAGLAFAKPALLSLRFGTEALPFDEIEGAAVVVLTGGRWAGLAGGKVDTASRSLVLPLQSTSPAGAAPAARAGLDAAPTSFAADVAVRVKKPVWLPTSSAGWTLEVVYLTRPTSTGPRFEYELIGTRNVTVKWTKPTFGNFDSLAGPQVIYTAPNQIPDVFSVVKSSVAVTQNGTSTVGLSFSFKLIRRNWRLDVFYFIDLPCSSTNTEVSIQLHGDGAKAYNTFSFRDDMTFRTNPAPPPAPVTVPTMASCNKCPNFKVGPTPGPLTLKNLTGGFFAGIPGFMLAGGTFQKTGLPGYSEDCPFPYGHFPNEGTDIDLPVILSPGNDPFWHLSNDPLLVESPAGAIVVKYEWRWVDGDLP
ncbi:MAG: hypothetical protein WCC53_14395 [Thermoanaerobaculia bacterium]